MTDRISFLPEDVLCHILSFLPTKQAVATSTLSKTWKSLWRSVPTIDLYMHQGLMTLPSSILSHRTLVVLKLRGSIKVETLSTVDFPSLKVLHLNEVLVSQRRHLAKLVSGCPVLEDLEANKLCFVNCLPVGKFKRLPKLVRAVIEKPHTPLKAVNNVEFLRVDWMDAVVNDIMMDMMNNDEETKPCVKDFIPMFNNLTHIELSYCCYTKDWLEVVEVLNHCPKLGSLVIYQDRAFCHGEYDEGGDWPYPQSVPASISLNLKSCCLIGFKGSEGEFRFARFIMQNARLLRTMTICFSITASVKAMLKMKKKLSSCTRHSATCELSIKW